MVRLVIKDRNLVRLLIERERLQQSVPGVSATGHRSFSSGVKRTTEKHSVGRSVSAGGVQSSAITALLRYGHAMHVRVIQFLL